MYITRCFVIVVISEQSTSDQSSILVTILNILHRLATLLSQKAQYSSAGTGSETKQEESSIRLHYLAAARNLLEIVPCATRA
jgi:hypothetical protein